MVPIRVSTSAAGENSQAVATSPCSAPPSAEKDYGNGDPDAPYNPPGARNTDSCLALKPTGVVIHDYATKGPAPGDVVFRWIHGSVCAAKNTDPRIQVVAYNEDTYILRENPCVNWQAPFTYLLFGNHGALLIDTGATPEASYYPLRLTVDEIVSRWCGIRFSYNIYAVCSDGDMMEGVGQEAASLAGHLEARRICAGSTTTTTSPSKGTPNWPSPKTSAGGSRAAAGMCCGCDDANDLTRIAPAYQDVSEHDRQADDDHRSQPHRLRRAAQAGHRTKPTASRWATKKSS